MGKIKRGTLLLLLVMVLASISLSVSAKDSVNSSTIVEVRNDASLAKSSAGVELNDDSDLQLRGTASILVQPLTGEILYEHNGSEKRYPASMTKIMTLVLTLEALNDGRVSLDDPVTASAYAESIDGSEVYIREGETFTLKEMMEAMMVVSANDCAVAIAEYIGGSVEEFADMMNEKAKDLGMDGTHYVNPNGLPDDNHYTTAEDMAKLCCYAVKVRGFLDYTSIKEITFRSGQQAINAHNTNKLLFSYDGVDGLKTGTTTAAGRCVAATAERNGLRLIAVTMGVSVPDGQFADCRTLLDYGFEHYCSAKVFSAGDVLTAADVIKGRELKVNLTTDKDLYVPAAKDADPEYDYVYDIKELKAPLTAGQSGGTVKVYKGDALVDTAKLLVLDDMEKSRWYQNIARFFKGLFGEK